MNVVVVRSSVIICNEKPYGKNGKLPGDFVARQPSAYSDRALHLPRVLARKNAISDMEKEGDRGPGE